MIGTSLSLFDLHEEAFELRCVSVRIEDRRRELIGQVLRGLALVLGDAAIAPVNRNADLIGLLPIDHHGFDTFRYHCFRYVLPTSTRHFYPVTTCDTSLVCKLDGYLNERLWNKLNNHRVVLGPVVIVLGQPIGCANDVETLIWCAQLVVLRLHLLDYGIGRLVRMKRIRDRAFKRLVVLGERPFCERAKRSKQAAYAFGIHDEWPHVILRVRVRFEVGYIVADPTPCCFAPPNLLARSIPR